MVGFLFVDVGSETEARLEADFFLCRHFDGIAVTDVACLAWSRLYDAESAEAFYLYFSAGDEGVGDGADDGFEGA